MKIKVYCSLGLVGDRTEKLIDLFHDWGITDEEWRDYSDEFKGEIIHAYIEYGYEELDD